MSDQNAKGVKHDWLNSQNDAQIEPDNLIDLVRLIARRAAERDFKHLVDAQSDPPDNQGGVDD